MHVLKVPYDLGGGTKSCGARYGPDAIEQQFRKWPWRGSEDGVVREAKFVEVGGKLSGRLEPNKVAAFLRGGDRSLLVLSGDNSMTAETVKGVASFSPDPHLVLLDAHFDACDFSHDPHAYWVRRLWEERAVRPERTFFFGVRDPESEEVRYVKENGATVIWAEDLDRVTPAAIISNLTLFRKVVPSTPLVFAVDIDVVDPAFAPGTGVLRSGGLSVRQVLGLIRGFGALPFPLKVGEISEVIPHTGNLVRLFDKRPDPAGLTVLAAEAIFREMVRSFS